MGCGPQGKSNRRGKRFLANNPEMVKIQGMKRWTDPFYLTKEWRALRHFVLRRDGYCCTICRINVLGAGQARVDHVRAIKDGGAPLDPANLRTLCARCDAQAHREKGHGGPRDARFGGSDSRGWPIDPSHPWHRR